MSDSGRQADGLRELVPSAPSGRSPAWLRPLGAFVLAVVATAVLAAVLQPFASEIPNDVASYDAGFAAGLEQGQGEARATVLEAEADAYRRGRESASDRAAPGDIGLQQLFRQVGAGEVELTTQADTDAIYRRGYLAGYSSGEDERTPS